MEIMQSFSIIRLKSPTLFQEFATIIQDSMSHYVRDLSGILLFYGTLSRTLVILKSLQEELVLWMIGAKTS